MSYGQFGLSRNQMLGGVGALGLTGAGASLGIAGAAAYAGHRRRKARLAAEAEAAMLADEADEAEYAMAVAQLANFRRPNPMRGRLMTGLKIGGGVGALGLAGAGAYAGHRLRKAQLAAEAEAALLADEADEVEYAMAQAQSARFGALARRNFLLSRTGRLAGKIGAGVAGVGALGAGGYGVYRATRPPVIEEDEFEEDDDAMYAMARPSAANFGNLARNNRWLSRRGRLAGKIGAGVAGVGALGAGGYGIYRATRPPVIEEEMGEDEYIDE